ncbi:MAG: four-helix bundle copper-binding protein [Chloroflexi bacterium]|nr:four-helix bundle copper-binding protein [Chloroflexota bacterium]
MQHMSHQTMSDEMLRCIDNCMECHRVCVETTAHCLQMGDKHAEQSHIRLLLDCAQICQTSADFMIRGSDLHGMTCGVCAEVCQRCAQDCERLDPDDSQMQACAAACRRCAASCAEMATRSGV